MNENVLITGASGGIGLEFARVFAKNGYDVVLVARNEQKLQSIARDLEETFHIKADYVSADLSEPDGAKKLYEEVLKRNIRVDQLVNNAGVSSGMTG